VGRVRAAVAATNPGLPVGVGLGVRDGDQAAAVGAYADGVIVGSALVSCLFADDLDAGLDSLRRLTADLAAGVRRATAA
jgi:tryptophan synthase alpha chain